MQETTRSIRTYKKTPVITIPELPPYFKSLLPSTTFASPLSQNDGLDRSPTDTLSPLGSPLDVPTWMTGSSSQPRLRQSPQTESEKLSHKFERMGTLLQDSGFDSVGELLEILFYNPYRAVGHSDPRTVLHAKAVARFLQGRNTVKMSDIITLIYEHKHSSPLPSSPRYHERHSQFSPLVSSASIFHARPSLFSWATNLVANHVHSEIHDLSAKEDSGHLRASSNHRRAGRTNIVTWEVLGKFSIGGLCEKFKDRAPVAWFITESMAASRKNGLVVQRKHRPHPIIQVGAISSFIVARNQYANGDLAMVLGIWHFAVKSHIDVKRVYCRFGNIVSDATVRRALDTMTGSSIQALQNAVKAATERGETEWCLVLDNVQEYCPVYEGGIARQSVLKVGTAATAICLDDCKLGSFDLHSHLTRVSEKRRKTMTVETLRTDIDWGHIHAVQSLHWTRVLVDYVPELKPLATSVSEKFRCVPIAKHRMREGRKTKVQPLGTNAERETETQGMARAIMDFDEQMGLDSEAADKLLSWVRGDGASYGTTLRLQKYLCSIPDNHKSFRNRIATPEIWHAKATMINSIATNHYGPTTSQDPSSLSRSSGAAGFKRPPNLSSCDYYPTVRSMSLIWEAQVLDCWRVYLDAEPDILLHFSRLASRKELPTLETILSQADILVKRYASQDAYEQALSLSDSSNAPDPMKVPFGTLSTSTSEGQGTTSAPVLSSNQDIPKVHQEEKNFNGDRVLANSILFLQDFGWWTEISYAIPEGDIGRAFEILKLWIFCFSGSSHQNYTAYLLEVYCLLKYEASDDLREAILNNWLVNITGELGKWIEADLLQEHYNRWLEDMVKKRGGDFDDNFYRHTLSPNVDHFLRIKEEIENAFFLHPRSKAHTSPHLSDELRFLLKLFKEAQLHLFCAQRTLGHAAINQFNNGYSRLDGGKLSDFINKSTAFADVITEIIAAHHRETANITQNALHKNPEPQVQVQPTVEVESTSDTGSPPPSRSASPSTESNPNCSSTSSPSSTVSETNSEDRNDTDLEDHSNAHLVSGSDHDIYISGNHLVHHSWDQEEPEEEASDLDEDEESYHEQTGIDYDCDNHEDYYSE